MLLLLLRFLWPYNNVSYVSQSYIIRILDASSIPVQSSSLSSVTLSQQKNRFPFLKAPPYTFLPPSLDKPSFTLLFVNVPHPSFGFRRPYQGTRKRRRSRRGRCVLPGFFSRVNTDVHVCVLVEFRVGGTRHGAMREMMIDFVYSADLF